MKINMRSWKTASAVLISLSLMMTACSGGSESNGEDGSSADKPTQISMNTLSYGTNFPDKNNVIVKEFEKRTNTTLDIDWVPVATSEDKFNVLYASGNLPDLTFVEDMSNQQIRAMINQGVFWDLTDMIGDYPNLSNEMLKDMWEISKIDGKNYSVPRYYPTHGGGVFPMLRQDWLNELNLPVPTTMDEFYNTLKAFKDNKLGGDKTIPYAASQPYMNFVYNVYNDTNGSWKLVDGQLYPNITQDESTEALKWIKKAYDEGLFPQDFVILTFAQITEGLQGGKAGGAGFSMNNSISQTYEIKKLDEDADLVPLTYLQGPEGNQYVPSGAPFYGHFLIPKKVSESKVKKILEFLDYGYSPEGNELANYGIKDVHFTEADGVKTTNEQYKTDLVGESFNFIFLNLKDEQVLGDRTLTTPEIFERNQSILDERKKINVPNPSLGLVSDASTKYMPDITKKVDDMRAKVILGQETIESYQAFINNLKEDSDLKKVVAEMNELYAQKIAAGK